MGITADLFRSCISAAALLWVVSPFAQAQPSSRVIFLNVGTTPGGGYDTYGRLLARHMGKFLEGNPTFVVRNMPGAASLVAANFIYSVAPKDGTHLGMFFAPTIMEPLMGNESVKFVPQKFSWIGSMDQDVSYCGIWTERIGELSFPSLLKGDREFVFASTGTSGNSFQHANILKNVLEANIRVAGPYKGMNEVFLAMERQEVDGTCALTGSSVTSQWNDHLKAGRLRLIVQMGPKTSTEFGPVPSVYEYADKETDQAILKALFQQLLLGRSEAAPPGIPQDLLQVYRTAFDQTMKSEDLLSDARKMRLSIDPVSGTEIERFFEQFSKYSPEIISKARSATGLSK